MLTNRLHLSVWLLIILIRVIHKICFHSSILITFSTVLLRHDDGLSDTEQRVNDQPNRDFNFQHKPSPTIMLVHNLTLQNNGNSSNINPTILLTMNIRSSGSNGNKSNTSTISGNGNDLCYCPQNHNEVNTLAANWRRAFTMHQTSQHIPFK